MHPKAPEAPTYLGGRQRRSADRGKDLPRHEVAFLELSVDRNDVVGACDHGYACAYLNSLAWTSPTTPLPPETNPRFVFERLFGIGSTAEERVARVQEDRSLLDGLTSEMSRFNSRLGARDRTKMAEYFDSCASSSSASPRPSRKTAILRCPTSRSACRRRSSCRADVRPEVRIQADITPVGSP
jgi:hypothetical protein